MEYIAANSPLHRLNPLTKLIGLVSFFVLGIMVSNPLALLGLVLVLMVLFKVAKAFSVFKLYFGWLLAGGFFMLLLQILFAHDGPELFRFIPKQIPILGWLGVINQDSIWLGLIMVTRMAVFGFALPLLLATTQARDLMLILVDKFKFPYQYALMLITALRFIPNLFMEIETILQAQRSRAFELRTKNPVEQVKAYFPLITPLVLISLKKAERLAIAMETRGFGCGKRTYLHQINFRTADWVISGTMSLISIAGLVLKVKGIIS